MLQETHEYTINQLSDKINEEISKSTMPNILYSSIKVYDEC